ncbi:Prolyl 4-hydroxylase 2 (AtP4H-2) (AtP4H2) [Durusdinium trenchii]|uniref:Prolyl 4-hydroxylase 2 (AtP4H-2) (AtP4H2) n=1 Tax=Durusdinium trenchii TaxID=1381693 RepID=A0ABP0PUA2_9DINO
MEPTSRRLAKALLLLVFLDTAGLRLFLPPPSATVPDVVAERLEPIQRKAAATATQAPPEPPQEMLVEVEEDLENAAQDYLVDLKQEINDALRDRNETSMVTILNHYGPRSEDAWLASLLMQALRDLLPGMFGAELGFLVMTMAYSEIRAAPVWHALADAAVEAALLETHPRTITEMAFGFAWVQWQQPDLFALLQVAMSSCTKTATDEQKRVFAWACTRVGQPAKTFGKPSFKVEKDIASKLWDRFKGLPSRAKEVKALKMDPVPLLMMPEAVPVMHCDALVKLANDQNLWVQSSELMATHLGGEMFVSARNSSTAVLSWHSNPSVKAVRSWAAQTLDVPESFIAPLQLVRYTEGQQIGSHMDWHDERDAGLWVFGQRMATMLVYLSTVPKGSGGETHFGSLGVSVQPQKGSAILWPNVNDIGSPEKRTIHSGRPVEGKKVKYAMNIWIYGRKQPDDSWIRWPR